MPDNLSREQRSYCMSRVRNRDTDLEQKMRSKLHKLGYRFRKHVKTLPGTPDIVFPSPKVVVFLDGDFWHGYRFPAWIDKVSPFWRKKIGLNRDRDQKNFRNLRNSGWKVMRIWQHEIKKDPKGCVNRIIEALNGT